MLNTRVSLRVFLRVFLVASMLLAGGACATETESESDGAGGAGGSSASEGGSASAEGGAGGGEHPCVAVCAHGRELCGVGPAEEQDCRENVCPARDELVWNCSRQAQTCDEFIDCG